MTERDTLVMFADALGAPRYTSETVSAWRSRLLARAKAAHLRFADGVEYREFVASLCASMRDVEVAGYLGMSAGAVAKCRRRSKVSPRRLTLLDTYGDEITRLANLGHSCTSIATNLEIPYLRVVYLVNKLKKMGRIEVPKVKSLVAQHGRQVELLRAHDVPREEIARRLNISCAQVAYIQKKLRKSKKSAASEGRLR